MWVFTVLFVTGAVYFGPYETHGLCLIKRADWIQAHAKAEYVQVQGCERIQVTHLHEGRP